MMSYLYNYKKYKAQYLKLKRIYQLKGSSYQDKELISKLIDKEVSRYNHIIRIKKELTGSIGRKQKRESINILERWLISLANDQKHDDNDPIFDERKLDISYPATKKMISELGQKGIPLDGRVENSLKIAKKFLGFNSYPKRLQPKAVYTEVGPCKIDMIGKVMVGEHQLRIKRERLEILSKLSSKLNVCRVVIRYACLLSKGQQWSIPISVYKYFVKSYGVTLEAFASPLNSNLLSIDKKGLEYCSLFLDTDKPFGSIGSFFDINIDGRKIIVNPPFTPSIIERTVEKILNDIEVCKNETTLFIFLPEWNDAYFYLKLIDSSYNKLDFSLLKGEHYYVDIHHNKIRANFHSHVFIISNSKDSYSNLKMDLNRIYKGKS